MSRIGKTLKREFGVTNLRRLPAKTVWQLYEAYRQHCLETTQQENRAISCEDLVSKMCNELPQGRVLSLLKRVIE